MASYLKHLFLFYCSIITLHRCDKPMLSACLIKDYHFFIHTFLILVDNLLAKSLTLVMLQVFCVRKKKKKSCGKICLFKRK